MFLRRKNKDPCRERISSRNYERVKVWAVISMWTRLETSASGSTVPKVALHRKRNVVITFLINTWKLFLTINANAAKILHQDRIGPF